MKTFWLNLNDWVKIGVVFLGACGVVAGVEWVLWSYTSYFVM